MKKIIYAMSLILLWFLPVSVWAAEKIEPPNLVETRVEGKFVDKSQVSIAQDQILVLEGTAKPNSEVYLYIYSEESPLLSQAQVDEEGSWVFDLNQVLAVGEHRIEGEIHQGSEISAKVELLKFNVTKGKLPQPSYFVIIGLLILALTIATMIVWFITKRKFIGGKK